MYIGMYIQKYIHDYVSHRGEVWSARKCIKIAIRRTVLVPGVCLCICFGAMMHYVHTGEAVVTTQTFDIFLLVTTRPIAHLERCVCIRNCVGELVMDTGQPLVTTNGM